MRFRFIDRVVSFEQGEIPRLVTSKSFPRSDEFVEGYPQSPGEVPSCLVLESLATSSSHLIYSATGGRVVGLLLRVDKAEIFSAVSAGEELVIETELLGLQPSARESVGLAQTRSTASAGDRKVAESRLVLICFPKDGFETSLPW